MNKQKRIPGLEPPKILKPDKRQTEPAFWVHRLRVAMDLGGDPKSIVRDVTFRRGLNIVWTPSNAGKQLDLFRDGLSGHTAGKTTLCRFVRYLLGEDHFCAEPMRPRIREKYEAGWVLGEVHVGRESWAVARPLSIGPRSIAQKGPLESLFGSEESTGEFAGYLDALSEATIGRLSAGTFPGSGKAIEWSHLLPWLARDQECGFSDFREWRHSESDSGAPETTVDEREMVIRSTLALVSDAEHEELRKHAALLEEQKEARRARPLLEHQAGIDHERLSRALGREIPPPSDGLFGVAATREIDAREAVIEEEATRLEAESPRDRLSKEFETAVAAHKEAQLRLAEAERLRAHLSDTVESLRRAADPLLVTLPPSRGFCQVPISLARGRECPLAQDRPVSLSERRSDNAAAADLASLEEQVQEHEARVSEERIAVVREETRVRSARVDIVKADTAYVSRRLELQKRKDELDELRRLVAHATRASSASAKRAEDLKRLEADLRESSSREEKIRGKHEREGADFSRTFDYVARALLGDEIEGQVRSAGSGLAVSIEKDGDRSSAALSTTKLLAFDLAAIVAGIEGRGHFPRFLLHDSPRGADLSPDIYDRLFLFAKELEGCFDGEPTFQYIITTTTAPPAALAKKPWRVLDLAGSPAERRFLACDL